MSSGARLSIASARSNNPFQVQSSRTVLTAGKQRREVPEADEQARVFVSETEILQAFEFFTGNTGDRITHAELLPALSFFHASPKTYLAGKETLTVDAVKATLLNQANLATVRWGEVFQVADFQEEGKMTPATFYKLLEFLSPQDIACSEKIMAKVFAKFDTDGDGLIGISDFKNIGSEAPEQNDGAPKSLQVQPGTIRERVQRY